MSQRKRVGPREERCLKVMNDDVDVLEVVPVEAAVGGVTMPWRCWTLVRLFQEGRG